MTVSLRKIKGTSIALMGMLCILLLSLVSCDKENVQLVTSQDFAESSIRSMQSGAIGKQHCLELLFPVEIEFIDGTVVEVADYATMKDTIRAFFEDNDIEKTKENKPSLVFPIEVLNEEGEVILVSSQEELRALKAECKRKGKGKGMKCFDLVFPVSLIIGEETLTFDTKDALKAAIKEYKETADEDAERPSLVYPVSVEYEDGTIVEVHSDEELKALKEDCKNE